MLGRGFVAGEDAIGGNNRVIVLTHQFWQRRYGGDAGIIGQTVSLNQIPYTVIGVLPPDALLAGRSHVSQCRSSLMLIPTR